jgi:hypothetical protein
MKNFLEKRNGSVSRFKVGLLILFLSLLLGGGVAFFVFFFQVQSIIIERDEADSNLRYEELFQMMESVKNKNLLVLSPEFLEKQLLIRFPELSVVSLRKKYPNSLVLQAKTDPVVLRFEYMLEDSEARYAGYVSERGTFFLNGDESLFLLSDISPQREHLSALQQVFLDGEVAEILEGKAFLEEVIKRKVVSAELLRDAQEIHFIDDQGVKYWIFLNNDFSLQIEKLKRTLVEHDVYKYPIEYVDLRIGRKVIYKPQ